MSAESMQEILTEVKGLSSDLAAVKATAAEVQSIKAELATAKENQTKSAAQLDAMAQDVGEFRKALDANYGKSGAQDWRQEWTKFVQGVYHVQKNKPIPQWLQKAVADYVVATDAQGGYLTPTLLADFVNKLTLVHGTIFPHLNKVTVPNGVAMRFPWESTLASVAWRSTQGGAGTEIDPAIVWNADTLRSAWINGYAKIGNEAFGSPGLSIPDNISMQLMSMIPRKIEEGVLIGDDSASAYPHDGIIVASNINSQTALATPTLALVQTFIGECIADHEGSADTAENFLVTTPAAAHVLKSGASAAGMNAWGDPSTGVPPTIHGYKLVSHPSCISTTNRLLMSPLGKITVGWSGSFSVSFNESLGWASNETWLMVSTYADFVIGNPDMHHKAVITALA